MNYSVYNFFNIAKETSIWNKTEEATFADIDFFYISSFIFKGNHALIQEDNPSEKIIIVEEELDGNDRDDIGNLEDLLRLVLINEECWNPKVVVDGGELAKNVNQKKKPDVFYKPVDVHSVTNAIDESISSISTWNIVNQLGNMIFLVGRLYITWKRGNFFLIKWIEISLT